MKCYVARAEHGIREKALSGGVFPPIAEFFISKMNGYVCAPKVQKTLQDEYMITNDVHDIDSICEMNLLFEDLAPVISKIEKLLDSGEKVLFVGSSYYVQKVKESLGDNRDFLYLMEFAGGIHCEKAYLEAYLQSYFPGKQLKSICLGDKDVFGWTKSITIEFENAQPYYSVFPQDPLLTTAEMGIAMPDAYTVFHNENQTLTGTGDLLLADFWSAGYHDLRGQSHYFDNLGVTLLNIFTKKGQQLLEAVAECLDYLDVIENRKAIINTYYDKHRCNEDVKQKFHAMKQKHGFKKAYTTFVEGKRDIGLLGLWNGGNYGAIVSAYGLYSVLEKLGYIPEFIDTAFAYGNRNPEALRYITDRCLVSRQYKEACELSELNTAYDTFVIGSDQCFNAKLVDLYHDIFMLPFIDDNKKKISVATSFGPERLTDVKSASKFRHYLSKFDALSVREEAGVTILENLGLQSRVLMDPIMIREKEDYIQETKDTAGTCEGCTVTYLLDVRKNTLQAIECIESTVGAENVRLLGMDYTNPWEADVSSFQTNRNVYEFVKSIMTAKYVITDSYHGMCLAILFNRPFTVLLNKGRGSERFYALAARLGLEKRIVDLDIEEHDFASAIHVPYDWNTINEKLEAMRRDALDWIKFSLEKTKHSNDIDWNNHELWHMQKRLLEQTDCVGRLQQIIWNKNYASVHQYFENNLRLRDFCIIRGAGQQTKKMLGIISDILARKEIELVIMDRHPGQLQIGDVIYQVHPINTDVYTYANEIVVSSWQYRAEMACEIKQSIGEASDVKILDIYDQTDIDESRPFYLDENGREY